VSSNIAAYALVAFLVLSAVVVVGAAGTILYRLVRGWLYDWAQAKHLMRETAMGRAVDAVFADPVEGHWAQIAEQDFYGSMSLADEAAWLPAPVAHEEDWLAQTRTDLAPETLDVSAEAAEVIAEALDGYGGEFGPDEDEGRPPWEPEPDRQDAGDYLAERTPAGEMWLIRWADRLPSWRIGLEPA
jgi:hypothetical protein